MKFKFSILALFTALLFAACSKSVEYSEAFKNKTSGKYLYTPDELMLVYYNDNTLLLNWKGGEITPVALSENEFFVPDMYKKFRFVEDPKTNQQYLSIIDEEDTSNITYDYLKVNDTYKTPSQHLEAGNYEEALAGFLNIKKQDSTSSYINEWAFNRKGYGYMRDKEYEKAIGVLSINAKLHPNSPNVYDSLAEAYLIKGDSSEAHKNYSIAIQLNPGNDGAQKFLDMYKPQ